MIKCFSDLIGRTMEAYVDDIVVKTRWFEGHIHDLTETFDRLKANGIKLNNEKCVFGVSRGACCLASWFSSRVLRPIHKKFQPSQIWGPYRTSWEFSESWGACPPLVASCHTSESVGFHSISY